MAFADALRENKDTLLRGGVLMLGGLALILAASIVGYGTEKVHEVSAGLLGFTGVCVMFLGFFLYVLPPLLPAK